MGKTGQEKQIISAREAGRLLGVPPQKVRERMRSGTWRIGIVSKTEHGYRYDISRALIRREFGV